MSFWAQWESCAILGEAPAEPIMGAGCDVQGCGVDCKNSPNWKMGN